MPTTLPLLQRYPTLLRYSRLSLANRPFILSRLHYGLNLLRNIVFILVILRYSSKAYWHLRGYGLISTFTDLWLTIRRYTFRLVLRLPHVRARTNAQISGALAKLEDRLVTPFSNSANRLCVLPNEPWSYDRIVSHLDNLNNFDHVQWENGRVSGTVYHGGPDLISLQCEAISRFALSNPIHPEVFPGLRKMEAEIVSMILSLFHAPPFAAGCTTSGGTESILLACYSARQKALAKHGITEPEMIIPVTAHAAFLKAGDYFKIKVHLVDCPPPSFKVDLNKVARHINLNTILLVGSAPNFPQGIIDDIAGLSKLAVKWNLPLHVDCCLGSFLMPFMEKAGFDCEPFDFRLPGVSSISCDTHKYGFAPKGTSTLLYRSANLRAYQYFITPDWPGGVYGSPGIAGSRPGALLAGCWASMMAMGNAGYTETCNRIIKTAREFQRVIREDEYLSQYLKILGQPRVSVVAFTTNPVLSTKSLISKTPHLSLNPDTLSTTIHLDIYSIADAMSKRGWSLNSLQIPPAIHVAFTMPMIDSLPDLISDIKSSVAETLDAAIMKANAMASSCSSECAAEIPPLGDMAALYGVAGSLVDKSIVRELVRGFLDTLYMT